MSPSINVARLLNIGNYLRKPGGVPLILPLNGVVMTSFQEDTHSSSLLKNLRILDFGSGYSMVPFLWPE